MLNRLLRSRSLYFVVGALMVIAAVYLQFEIRIDPRPLGEPADIERLNERNDLNLLFVLIDTLRADRLSAYGYDRETSPTLDKLAATGIRFSEHMSQSSWTKCSMASLWTGLYPIRTGVTRSPQGLPDEARMPAEILREAGFRTAAIWRNGWISPSFGFSQGFEVYHSPKSARMAASVRREKPTLGVTGTDQDVVNSAIEFLRAQGGDERWFLYIHLMDVHQYVYDEDTALFGTTYSDIYDNSIRWTDRVLGALIRDLDMRGLRDKTLIVVAGDHGEAFGEHGREGHARDVHGEVTTTPLIMSFPFRLPGIVVDAPTENVDLWPTLLDLLKLPPLEDVDGQSRLPAIMAAARGEPAPPRDTPRFAHLDQTWGRTGREPRPMVAVREGPYRLVRAHEAKGWLYDRGNDPSENVDISEDEPEVLARLQAYVDEYLERPQAPWTASDVELDDMQLQQLRALGYDVE
jgi:arylsulfatase A-like enzyme